MILNIYISVYGCVCMCVHLRLYVIYIYILNTRPHAFALFDDIGAFTMKVKYMVQRGEGSEFRKGV
jgi:hypothetical protein